MAESSTAVDGGPATLIEPVAVGAVVGGIANLVNTDVLFPGWGVVAGALVGLGCGLVLRSRDDEAIVPASASTADLKPLSESARSDADEDDEAATPEKDGKPAKAGALAKDDERATDDEPATAGALEKGEPADAGDGGSAGDEESDGDAEPAEPPAPRQTRAYVNTAEIAREAVAAARAEAAAIAAQRKAEEEQSAAADERSVVPASAIVSATHLAGPLAGDSGALEVMVARHQEAGAVTAELTPTGVRRVAIAVGATDGGSARWAQSLVGAFARASVASATDPAAFGRVLAAARRSWTPDGGEDATAAFSGVEVIERDGTFVWRAVCAGGCRLLVLDGGALVSSLPADGTDDDPLSAARGGDDVLRRSTGVLPAGQCIVLCSPAVADWATNDTRRRLLGEMTDSDVGALASDVRDGAEVAVVRIDARG